MIPTEIWGDIAADLAVLNLDRNAVSAKRELLSSDIDIRNMFRVWTAVVSR